MLLRRGEGPFYARTVTGCTCGAGRASTTRLERLPGGRSCGGGVRRAGGLRSVLESLVRYVTGGHCPNASIYSLAAFPALFLRLAPDRADQRPGAGA